MKKKKIKSIEKGYGMESTYYAVNPTGKHKGSVHEIKEETKIIGKGYYNNLELTVFRGYRDGNLIFEIEQNSSLTITYFES